MPVSPVRAAHPRRRLEVFLVRPTKYDDDGYLLRHLRNVLPSNSLACLHALTEEAARGAALREVEVRSHLCDESVQALPERRLRRAARRRDTKVVLCLVGVQTSQFPRAAEIARRFGGGGIAVLIGGFHVSGRAISAPELRVLAGAGVTLVRGEVEGRWASILADAAHGRLAPVYDFLDAKPDLSRAPVPRLDAALERKFVYRHFGTIDTSRGCPFNCSFCAIIQIQGRRMRGRDPGAIGAAIEANYREIGTHHYFFTDDDFARNGDWPRIFDEIVRLRRERGVAIRFLMQVDALAQRIPGFVAAARRAGCFQVFIGLESLNPESLRDANKKQNRVGEYAEMIRAWRDAGILTHVGYIIGFPHDTADSVRENLRALREEVEPDLASFFMLTPLPGSADYARLLDAGAAMDADFNRYDTFHPVFDHPAMSRSEWLALYREAWRDFYSHENMLARLRATASAEQRVTLLQMYLWYRAAAVVEGFHPMMTGFVRLKPRTDRREGFPVEGRLRHLRHRLPEMAGTLRGYGALLVALQRLWVATAPRLSQAAPAPRWRDWATFVTEMFLGRSPRSAAPRYGIGFGGAARDWET